MLKIRRILRDYDEAGSLNSLIALWGFVDDETFLTKAGHVGLVYRLAGVDYECLDHSQRRDVVHRYEAAFCCLDDSCRVYQYLIKRTVAPIEAAACRQRLAHQAVQRRAAYLNSRRTELYKLDLHLVLIYEGLRPRGSSARRLRTLCSGPRSAIREWLSPSANLALVEADLDRAVAQLHHKGAAFEVQLADSVRPTRLSKVDAFRFFRRLLNYTPHVAAGADLQYDTHLDYFVADSSVDCHRGHLQVDAVRVKVLSLKEPPSATFPQVLEDLYTLPGEFIACLEWCRIPNDRMRRGLQLRRRHFFNKRVSIVNYVSPETRPEEMLVDESANATVRQLGDAMTEMEVNGHFFGDCSLTLVLHNEDSRALERTAAEAVKAMAAHDGTFIEEPIHVEAAIQDFSRAAQMYLTGAVEYQRGRETATVATASLDDTVRLVQHLEGRLRSEAEAAWDAARERLLPSQESSRSGGLEPARTFAESLRDRLAHAVPELFDRPSGPEHSRDWNPSRSR